MLAPEALDPETLRSLYDDLSLTRLRSAYGVGGETLPKSDLLFELRKRANHDAERPDDLITLFYRLWRQNSAGVPLVQEKSIVVNDKTINYRFIEQHEWEMPGFGGSHHLLVRDEYVSILNTIKAAQNGEVRHVIVTGQPGIGKTAFLYYVLLTRLCNGEATTLQEDQSYYYLFNSAGARRVPSDRTTDIGVWSLLDSNYSARVPCRGFVRGKGGPIVEAASPHPDRYKGWAKEYNAWFVLMDLWSLDEMQALGAISDFDADRLTQLFEKWGPSPRFLRRLLSSSLEDCNLTDIRQEQHVQTIMATFMRNFESVVSTLADLTLSKPPSFEDYPHLIFFIRPINSNHELLAHPVAHVTIPTRYLRHLVAAALATQEHVNQANFFRLFNAIPSI